MSTPKNDFPFTLRKIGEEKYLDSQQLLNNLIELGFEFTVGEELIFSKIRCELDEKEEQIIKEFEAVELAMNSMRLSGFEFTKEEIYDLKRLTLGEVTREELHQKIDKKLEKLKVTNPEFFAPEAFKN